MNILIADDDPVSRRLLKGTLIRLGHDVDEAADGTNAIQALLEPQGARLAILDWMMPGYDGLTVCRTVRAKASHYVYIILLTARDRREDLVAALDAEADDYLTKPFDAVELRARLRSGERVLALQEHLLRAQEDLRRQAHHDGLTGLWNRGMILDFLNQEVRRLRGRQRPIAVMLADVDHFKQANDRHGHAIGDVLLRQAAERMRGVLRSSERNGRYGGEEFMMVVTGCDRAAAVRIADRARAAVAAAPVVIEELSVPVTVSVGVAWTDAPDSSADLLAGADQALYRAKAAGRNCVSE
jgi:diguanylate cyclase (GGDEF)-like protein